MDGELHLANSRRLSSLTEKFHNKQYRDGYVAAHTRRVLAEQMRNFRGSLSQADFAEKLGKQKTVIGRLENPAYGGWSVRTMFEIARKLNVAVFARFVDFPTFLKYTNDLSDGALNPTPYEPEIDGDIANTRVEARAPLKELLDPNWLTIAASPREDKIEVAAPSPAFATGKIAANNYGAYYQITKRQTNVR
jgi:hypothetical protein